MSKNISNAGKPTHEEIAALAQRIYEAEGRPQGKAVEHWLRAEAQLVAARQAPGQTTVASSPGQKPARKAPAQKRVEAMPAAAPWQPTPGETTTERPQQNLRHN